jgi:hypothetical protein
MECAGCGDGLTPKKAEPEAVKPTAELKPRRMPIGLIIIAVVACLGIGGLLFSLFGRTEETVATVSAVQWERTIPIEILAEVEGEDWLDLIPTDATLSECQEAYRYSQSEPAPNAIEVCGTPYTVDQGSGYGEVVQDCEYEVYDQFCTYFVVDWVVFDTVTTTGNSLSPYWPSTTLNSDQRMGDRSEIYQVSLEDSEGTYIYSPKTEQEFLSFTHGSSWILEINALGGVVSLSPAD